jgi:uncharacterized protein YjlB
VGWEVEVEVVKIVSVETKVRLGVDRVGEGEEMVAFGQGDGLVLRIGEGMRLDRSVVDYDVVVMSKKKEREESKNCQLV